MQDYTSFNELQVNGGLYSFNRLQVNAGLSEFQ